MDNQENPGVSPWRWGCAGGEVWRWQSQISRGWWNWPGPSGIITKNSQMWEESWESLARLLTCERTSGVGWGIFQREGPSGQGESRSFQNLPRFCHQRKKSGNLQRRSRFWGWTRSRPCGRVWFWKSSWKGTAASQVWIWFQLCLLVQSQEIPCYL